MINKPAKLAFTAYLSKTIYTVTTGWSAHEKSYRNSSLIVAAYIKNESIEVLFDISACASTLTNPMLSGVTFLF